MATPARRNPWTVRELAPILGISPAALGHLRTGRTETVYRELALRFSEATGRDPAVLFVPIVSEESDDQRGAA